MIKETFTITIENIKTDPKNFSFEYHIERGRRKKKTGTYRGEHAFGEAHKKIIKTLESGFGIDIALEQILYID